MPQQVRELDPLVAAHAGDRSAAGGVGRGEVVDHGRLEAGFEIEDVVRDAKPIGDGARILDVAAGTACALAAGGRAVVVELERDADDLVAGLGEQCRGHRAVDAARHGDDDAAGRRQVEIHGPRRGAWCGERGR